MRLGEKGVLASLLLILLAFSTGAQTRIFEGAQNTSESGIWESELGLYLPFVLFTLISTYHFLDWAQKHKRQAILTVSLLIGAALLIGFRTPGAKPAVAPITPSHLPIAEQGGSAIPPVQQFAQLQESLLEVGRALTSTPYYSYGANAFATLVTVAVIVLLLLKARARVKASPIGTGAVSDVVEVPARSAREAVIRFYLLACKALESHGVQISDSDTPSDIYVRATSEQPSVADQLLGLTLLFQEAKFSVHPITEQVVADAQKHLEGISSTVTSSITS